MDGNAKLTFDADHEIMDFACYINQGKTIATHIPAIMPPGGSSMRMVAMKLALEEGGHWFQVDPGSDIPLVGVLDARDLKERAAPETDHDAWEKIQWIGYSPKFIKDPIEKPLVFPGMARYVYGGDSYMDLYNIGGESDNANLTPADSNVEFDVHVHFSTEKLPSTEKARRIRVKNIAAFVHATADTANVRYYYLPCFVFTANGRGGYVTFGGTTGSPTVAAWAFMMSHIGTNMNSGTVNIGNNLLTPTGGLSGGHKIQAEYCLQATAIADGQINAAAILELHEHYAG